MPSSNTDGKHIQYAIAAGSLAFGVTALGMHDWFERLFARDPSNVLPVVGLAVTLLGTHAIAGGLFATFRRFSSWTYPGFALALAPILAADLWFFAKTEGFSEMLLVHAGGVIAVLALCVRGFRLLRASEAFEAQPA